MPSASALFALVLGVASTAASEEHFCEAPAQADVLLQRDAARTPSSSRVGAPVVLREYALDRGALDAMVVKAVAKEMPPERTVSEAAPRAPAPPKLVMSMRGAHVNEPHGADPPVETPIAEQSHESTETKPSQESTETSEASESSTQAVAPSKLLSAAVRVELNIPKALGQIHAGEHGPLGRFLTNLKAELVQSVGIPEERLSILGVRGEYMEFSKLLQVKKGGGAALELLGRNDPHSHSPPIGEGQDGSTSDGGKTDSAPAAAAASSVVKGEAGAVAIEGQGSADSKNAESIVDLEILPANSATEPSPNTVFLVMQRQLNTPDSRIMSGPFMELLRSASIALPARPANATTIAESDRSGSVRGALVRITAATLLYLACVFYYL